MNIAVWYHTKLSGGKHPPIDDQFAIGLMIEQMELLKQSGLQESANEIVICSNGGKDNALMATMIAPPKSVVIDNGEDYESLLRTVNKLRKWCQTHRDWLVCFFHAKGVTHPGSDLSRIWRRCMERHVILNWKRCVNDLQSRDTVGAHWLTKEVYGSQVTYPFWGGMFFWAKAEFLAELPELPDAPKCRQDWFLSENWIGMGKTPIVKDYAPHWPGIGPCSKL